MKNRTTILNAVLAAVLGVALLISIILQTMCPQIIIPEVNIPYIAAISLIALVLTSFVKTDKDCVVCEAILAGITFGVLPWAAGAITGGEILKYALVGAIVFAVLNEMFKAMVKRIDLAGACKGAVIPAAFGLYLACQCFAGWIL